MLFTEMNSGDGQDTPVEELFPDERGENLPDQVIDQQETKRLIREIIDELPEDQRAAIGMFYYEEMTVKEIAAAVVAVGLGAFIAARIVPGSAEPQKPAAVEDVIGQEPSEEPEEDPQPAEETAEPEESPQPAEEAEEETSVSYIFSNMPIAAYEVTGLGVGRFETVYEEEVFIEYGNESGEGYYQNYPLVRLTPGENTFVIFCIPGDVGLTLYENGSFSAIGAAIHSPSGSSQWEAIAYMVDSYAPEIEGFSKLERMDAGSSEQYVYDEETYEGRIYSMIDPMWTWIQFAEIYHADAQQNDAIYAIEAYGYPDTGEDYLKLDNILAHLASTFEELGATSVGEIPVEEALQRYNIVVSEGGAD